MAKLKFKDENDEFVAVVQDVKVNDKSVFDGKEANIDIKTINNQSLIGKGNLDINNKYEITARYNNETLYIQDDDLLYIRTNVPNVLIVNMTDQSTFTLILYLTNQKGYFEYENIKRISSRITENTKLRIYNTDTYMTGSFCDVFLYEFYYVEFTEDQGLNNTQKLNARNNINAQEKLTSGTNIKTIENNSILGSGNISLECVKYTANQNLTTQQKLNARTNIEAIGTDNIKQATGQSTTDVISQKGVTDELANKQDIIDNTLNTTNKTIPTAINEVNSIAKGANQALSYSNYSSMITEFNTLNDDIYIVGQNVMIITLDVPDLWISGIESISSIYTYTTDENVVEDLQTNGYIQVGYYKLSMLETQKVDLTNYQIKIDTNNKLSADLVDDTSTTNKFVTSTEKNTWNSKQNLIDSSNKLSADLVDDTNTTNKFVTANDKAIWNNNTQTIKELRDNSIKGSETGTTVTLTDQYPTKLLDYKVTGNSVQETTSSPIYSVGDLVESGEHQGEYAIPIKVGGKNLFDYSNIVNLALSSTIVEASNYKGYYIPYKKGETYTISRNTTTDSKNNRFRICFTYDEPADGVSIYNSNGEIQGNNNFDNSLTATISSNIDFKYMFIYLSNQSTTSITKEDVLIQIELGTSATPYEDYIELSIVNIYADEPLRKIDTYTDYIDFKNGKIVRNVEAVDESGTLPIEDGLQPLIPAVEENIELPDITPIANTCILQTDTNVLGTLDILYIKDTNKAISGGGGGSTAKKKTLTNSSQNYSVLNNVVTVTDADVTTNTHIMLYPADTTTEEWLENNLSSCIITEASGSFSFDISDSLPATFSMYYIVMEVE